MPASPCLDLHTTHDKHHTMYVHTHTPHDYGKDQAPPRVRQLVGELNLLTTQLGEHEKKLAHLIALREKIKHKSNLWWADVDQRHAVDLADLDVSDEVRVIANIIEDCNIHWREIKPYYGLHSKMFLAELSYLFFSTATVFITYALPFLPLSIATLLLLGPIAIVVLYTLLQIGYALVPLMVILYCAQILNQYPFLLLEYSPTLTEFTILYCVALSIAISCAMLLGRYNASIEERERMKARKEYAARRMIEDVYDEQERSLERVREIEEETEAVVAARINDARVLASDNEEEISVREVDEERERESFDRGFDRDMRRRIN